MRSELWLKALFRWNVLLPLTALLAGVAAATGAGQYVKTRAENAERQLRARYESKAVVVASQDVRRGQQLDSRALAVREMPRDFIPADALDPARAAEILGTRTAIDIRRGTPVVPAALLSPQMEEPLAAHLPNGHRALTIQVDQVNSLSGQLRPGDSVDLLYSRSESSASKLVPLLERVRVLATGAATSALEYSPGEEEDSNFNTVTLLVTSEEAARIVLAEQAGRITVLLRSSTDLQPVEIGTRDSRDLVRRAGSPSGGRGRSARIELLTGGHGAEPVRSWLITGDALPVLAGATQ